MLPDHISVDGQVCCVWLQYIFTSSNHALNDCRSLSNEEVNKLQSKANDRLVEELGIELR
jgi:hypothetical protein